MSGTELSGQTPDRRPSRFRDTSGVTIIADLLSGILVYGGLGWLIAHFTGIRLLIPLGMVLGLALSVYMIARRNGKTE